MEKTVLNVNDLIETLGISRTTVYQLLRRDDFPKARLGKRIVVPIAALNDWLARGGTAEKAVNE